MGNIASSTAYNVPISGTAVAERSNLYRSCFNPNTLVETLDAKSISNLWDLFQYSMRSHADKPFLGVRRMTKAGVFSSEYTWSTRRQFEQRVLNFGSGVVDLGLAPVLNFDDNVYVPATQLRPVGIYSKNREEWFIAEYAAAAFGLVLIPLYDTLGTEAVEYIINQTEMTTIIVLPEGLRSLVSVASNCPSLKNVVVFDREDIDVVCPSVASEVQAANLSLSGFSAIEAHGEANRRETVRQQPGDVWTLCYTSGTTSRPKGVILTQQCIVSTVSAGIMGHMAAPSIEISADDVHLSYLPLAHVFERVIATMILSIGGSIGLYSGETARIFEDVQVLSPTLFISVPRVYSKMIDKVTLTLEQKSSSVQYMFNAAVETKIGQFRKTGEVSHRFLDKLVFNKMKTMMGGRLRFMLSGGAPMDSNVLEKIQVIFGVPVCEGYGMTETMGASFMALPGDRLTGHVGCCQPCIEFCLESVPDMNYHADKKAGELLIRGPSVCQGYFRNAAETQASFTSDGFMRTGDIVKVLPNGAIKIVDRKKNIFKLSQGEYVAPEKIEQVYMKAGLVGQVFVHGYSTSPHLIALVLPDDDFVKEWRAKGGDTSTAALHDAIRCQMECQAAEAKLKGFEKVKKIHFITEPFSTENGLMTPTFKFKRHAIKEHYAETINALFSQLA
ncbi:MAG: hypothetical protein KVP17_001299 [Porospora cf. gigantea B]|uniref:uncharacterized protein n=1 Tax=Porospora cf. gigantea B TaxID=2853592 RepID=UPI003571E1E4|nr:MAG: hypothetical protein KVP17_001299 [Porospora cf. gigantea B]